MENNLFDIKGIWIYDSEHLPTPSFTYQTVIDTQEQFLALNDNTLFGEYILNCDIDKHKGARGIKNVITREVEDLISDKILKGNVRKGDKIVINASNEELEILSLAPVR